MRYLLCFELQKLSFTSQLETLPGQLTEFYYLVLNEFFYKDLDESITQVHLFKSNGRIITRRDSAPNVMRLRHILQVLRVLPHNLL